MRSISKCSADQRSRGVISAAKAHRHTLHVMRRHVDLDAFDGKRRDRVPGNFKNAVDDDEVLLVSLLHVDGNHLLDNYSSLTLALSGF